VSTTKKRMTYTYASGIAKAVCDELAPCCDRIEVVGSVRRRAMSVGDIELLLVPTLSGGMFGCGDPEALDRKLQELIDANRLAPGRCDGDKHKSLRLVRADQQLDLYLVTPDEWGCAMVIRTGPAGFSNHFVKQRRWGGLCPDYLTFAELRVWRDRVREPDEKGNLKVIEPGTALDTPEERDVFDLVCSWIPPHRRTQL